MKKLFTNLALMGVLSAGTACQKSSDTGEASRLPAQTINNVFYGTDSAQKMDVYLPAGRTDSTTKLMVMIHGGAWMEGDKRDFNPYVEVLKKQLPDYAIANINYRLATQTGNWFPTQENDIKQALQSLYDKRKEYAFSDKVVLLGASAGGHLALLQGYKYSAPVKPQAIVSFFGPTDLTAMYNAQTNAFYKYALSTLIGGTPTTAPERFAQSSPITFVTPQSPPTLLLHGSEDPLVPVQQAQALKTKLAAAGVPHELIVYPREGHGWTGANLTASFNSIAAFLKKHVK